MKNKRKNFKETLSILVSTVALIGVVGLMCLGLYNGWIRSSMNQIVGELKSNGTQNPAYYTSISNTKIQNTVIVAGVIRNTGDGWHLIENNTHCSLNCDGVFVNNGTNAISIDYSSIKAQKVISFVVSPDETFSLEGYSCGASVGLEHANVFVHKSIDGVSSEINPQDIISDKGNFWFIGVFEV